MVIFQFVMFWFSQDRLREDFFKYLQGGAGDHGVQAMGEWCRRLWRLCLKNLKEKEGGCLRNIMSYSYGHLPVITGYKWDYTFYKWGYKYL